MFRGGFGIFYSELNAGNLLLVDILAILVAISCTVHARSTLICLFFVALRSSKKASHLPRRGLQHLQSSAVQQSAEFVDKPLAIWPVDEHPQYTNWFSHQSSVAVRTSLFLLGDGGPVV